MTKAEKARIAEMEYYASRTNFSGAAGCIFELECASKYSRKTAVGKQGQTDVYVRVDGKNYKAECKTNGGRVESLFTGENRSRFVIYRLDFVQKHKATKKHEAYDEVRHADAVILPTEVFCEALRFFGALKSTNGTNPELAVQPSNKRLWLWLLDCPTKFIPGHNYEGWEFDEIEIYDPCAKEE